MSTPELTVPICSCGSLLCSVGGPGNIGDGYFKGKRFLCLRCGSLYANAPREQPSTPEAESKITALETEFMVNCGSKLFHFGMWRHDCEACRDDEHINHASARDWRELNDALKWISDRTGKEFGMVNGYLGHYAELTSSAMSITNPKNITELLRGGI